MKETEFVVKVGEKILTVKDISAYVCDEAYYTPEVSKKIDQLMKKFHDSTLLMQRVS